MSEDFYEDDDIPWAPPEIRINYQHALGKFLLIYNQIDYLLLNISKMALARIKREDLASGIAKYDLWFRIYILDLLKSTTEGQDLSKFPTEKLKQLSGDRAVLAHGHMEQNPFDGSYSLICKGKDKGEDFSTERINKMAKSAEELWNELRYIEARYIFSDVSNQIK